MPKIVSPAQYGLMQAIAHHTARNAPKGLSAESAHAGIMELSPGKRSKYARALQRGKTRRKVKRMHLPSSRNRGD